MWLLHSGALQRVLREIRSSAYKGCWCLMKVVRAGCAGIVVGVGVLLSARD